MTNMQTFRVIKLIVFFYTISYELVRHHRGNDKQYKFNMDIIMGFPWHSSRIFSISINKTAALLSTVLRNNFRGSRFLLAEYFVTD